jgi:5-hydroxyisourate hydrolase
VGRLTTHVLDTANGCPGAGMAVRLYADDNGTPIVTTRTNGDGRCDAPLLADAALKPAIYVLAFEVGAYFRARGMALPKPSFLEVVLVQFAISDANAHYHVPLLVSPFGYSTYRGS